MFIFIHDENIVLLLNIVRAGEVVQWLIALAALLEDLYPEGSSVIYNSSPRELDALFWLPRVVHVHGEQTYKQTKQLTYNFKKLKLKKCEKNMFLEKDSIHDLFYWNTCTPTKVTVC